MLPQPSLLSLNNPKLHSIHSRSSLSAWVRACRSRERDPMAQAAMPPEPKLPNPCAAFRPPPPPPARRPDAAPWPARPKDAPCATSSGDKVHSGQCNKAPENVMHKPSGGTYSKPEARVKLIPAEEITYVRHGKTFARTVGSDKLEKRHRRRSVTPPPSSRKVSLARSTPLPHKATAPLPPHKPTSPLAHKPTSPLAHKPTTPPPPVASYISAKRSETAENRQVVSLRRPSPFCKAVQRGAVPPAVLRKESEMNPISPSSVHALPPHSSKVSLATKAEPSPKSVSTLDNSKLYSTRNQAALQCQRPKRNADPIVEKELNVKLSLLSSTSVLSMSSTEVCPDTRSRPSSRPSLFDGKCKLASLQPETSMPRSKSPESTTQATCVEQSNDFEAAPSTKSLIRDEPQTNQDASISCNMSSGASLILHTEPRKTYRPDACWKGKFEVTGELKHTCDELEAHFPHEIFIKVYEASKQMPEVLKLEALPLSHLLPKKFKMEPPDAHDIGLCFISSHQRPNRNFDHLLEKVSSHTGLRANIGITELIIFSSKLLTEDDQTKDGKLYFCGVFRKHLRKKQHPANNDTEKVEGKKSGIILDLTGEEEPNGISKCSPCKSAARTPACGDLILDSPPGFPLDGPPPGFTSAHRRLRRGETAESQIDSSSLVLDDVPPGFTSAHRGLHSTLFSEKSTIKFSLNVTRPIQTPGLPAFPKARDKITATGNVHVKHDKVDVQVDDGSEERQFPKIKRLSDILGSSSASSSNNGSTSSRPRNCSEVCISGAAVPRASKFQETGPPEIQKHCRKRGQPELSEPSGAEATKRLRVNGHIALNGSVDRRVLNGGKS
ncbi:hypothetical protein ACQ4PT_062123 [Festuca glaucescens]